MEPSKPPQQRERVDPIHVSAIVTLSKKADRLAGLLFNVAKEGGVLRQRALERTVRHAPYNAREFADWTSVMARIGQANQKLFILTRRFSKIVERIVSDGQLEEEHLHELVPLKEKVAAATNLPCDVIDFETVRGARLSLNEALSELLKQCGDLYDSIENDYVWASAQIQRLT